MNDIQALTRPITADAPPSVMVFVRDSDSEGVIRSALNDLGIAQAAFANGGVQMAVVELRKQPSPRLLVVDVSGESDPLPLISELAEVCDPSTGVIVVGETNDIRFYRYLKDSGVVEYFFKPLVSNLITRAFNAILTGSAESRGSRTGKLIFALSVRGGAGATTIAVRSAWHLAEARQRRVLLVDLDLHAGDAALQLDSTPTHALREALEHPERVDDLFLERGVIRVTPRFGLFASLEPFDEAIAYQEEAILSLLANLLRRYRYVFVDLPGTLAPMLSHVLHLPSMCLLVSDTSLVSARDVRRWRERIGPNNPERSTLHILNKNGAHGGLPLDQFARAAGQEPDIVIDYEREIGLSSTLGVKGMTNCVALTRALAPVLRHVAGEPVEQERTLLSRIFG